MAEKLFYTWEKFEIDIQSILFMIQDLKHKPKIIYGIPRGGLPLAVKLSNVLQIPLVFNLFEAAGRVKLKKNVLIVDDISDSGKTLVQIPFIHSYTTLTLFIRNKTLFKPDVFVTEILDDKWVIFPWEDQKKVKEEKDGTLITHMHRIFRDDE